MKTACWELIWVIAKQIKTIWSLCAQRLASTTHSSLRRIAKPGRTINVLTMFVMPELRLVSVKPMIQDTCKLCVTNHVKIVKTSLRQMRKTVSSELIWANVKVIQLLWWRIVKMPASTVLSNTQKIAKLGTMSNAPMTIVTSEQRKANVPLNPSICLPCAQNHVTA